MSSSLKWRSRYDNLAEKFGALPESSDFRDKRQYKTLQRITDLIFRGAHDNLILDVGCGNGRISECISNTNRVYGLDLSLKILQVARDKKRIMVNSDALHLPFANKMIDAVISFGFLQLLNLEDALQCIREFNRVTKEDGVLVLSTLNGDSLLHRLLARNHAGKYYERRYNLDEITQLLTKNGFAVEEMYLLYPPLRFFYKSLSFGIFNRLVGSTFVIKARKQ